MLILMTTAALAGALLAFRFTVLILLPATGVLAVGLTTGTEAWIVFLQTIGVIVSMQLGLLAGAVSSFLLRSLR